MPVPSSTRGKERKRIDRLLAIFAGRLRRVRLRNENLNWCTDEMLLRRASQQSRDADKAQARQFQFGRTIKPVSKFRFSWRKNICRVPLRDNENTLGLHKLGGVERKLCKVSNKIK
jgi:hypothetical protein